MNDHFTPKTPWELQREGPEGVWTVVGYHAEKPAQASERGFRAVDRSKKGAA